jgi:predicted nucleic acid-binding protein
VRYWLDTNVLLRLVTKAPEDLFQRALELVEQAEAGRFSLAVNPLHVAEATYVMKSLYRYSRVQVRQELATVLRLLALEVLDEEEVLAALDLMAEQNVDFDDAYLALWVSGRDEGVASFDQDFARLGVLWREP